MIFKLLGVFLIMITCGDITDYVANAPEKDVRTSFRSIYEYCPQEAIKIPCGFPILEISQVDLKSGFGGRYHPIDKIHKQHNGIDLASPKNAVISTGFGHVAYAAYRGGYGLQIVIDHGNSYTSSYSHLSEIWVREGDYIELAQKIGKVGSTGKSTGNHLHYEIKKNGKHVNPAQYLILLYKASTYSP
jgi:murein DD-endopeptidase MepM/ murein hydrolase activator NlpD